ncbi:hypothetical protein H9I48_00380 [Wolbachia pipientis]|nr:hypothetical protein [Wolbachia pipientis]
MPVWNPAFDRKCCIVHNQFSGSQCLYDVIPVPRHWDPGNLTLNKWLHNKD